MSHLLPEEGAAKRWGWTTFSIFQYPAVLMLTTAREQGPWELLAGGACKLQIAFVLLLAKVLIEWALNCLPHLAPCLGSTATDIELQTLLERAPNTCEIENLQAMVSFFFSFFFFFPDKTTTGSTIHYLVRVLPEAWLVVNRDGKWRAPASSSDDVAQKPGSAVSHLLVQTYPNAAPETMQRKCPKSKQRNPTVNVLLLCMNEDQELQCCWMWGCFGAATDVLAKEAHIHCLTAFCWKNDLFPPQTALIPTGSYLSEPHS